MIRVLIVDDDRLACMGLRSMLPWEKYGMQVVGEAANGQKALEFLEEQPVDLMMVDLAMPVMDGLQLIRVCKERYPAVCHVVMTFHEDFTHVQEALRLGVIDYISKLKIESENSDKALKRIVEKLNDGHEPPCLREKEGETAELFASTLWLYDDMAMDALARKIEQDKYHPRSIEVAAASAIARIESTLALKKQSVPHLEDAQSAVLFLYDYRRNAVANAVGVDNTEARLLVAVDYVTAHFSESLHAEDVAAFVNLSRSYLSICFKKSLGITFNDFLRRKRIFEAQKLLKNTTLSIQKVANIIGYENYMYFKDVFREIVGSSPYAYRVDFIRKSQHIRA